MANKKISELTLFATANSTDEIPVNRLGMNGKLTVASLGSFSHYIGESYGGGVIFHLWKDNAGVEHGLIVSIVDLNTSSVYSNITSYTNALSTWNGQANTNALKAQVGATSGAWKHADDYSYNGFTDWYLPAIDELMLLANNRFNVNKTLSTIGGATEIPTMYPYWSSSQSGSVSTFAYNLNFSALTPSDLSKGTSARVRGIRQF